MEGSKYGAGLFPSTTLPDGQVAHFYHWGQSTHAPIDPPAEKDDPAPVTLLALGLHMPSLPPPPAPVYGDLPNLFKPRSPKCPVPYTHSLPVEPHLCLRDACSLYGSIPGEGCNPVCRRLQPYVLTMRLPIRCGAHLACSQSISGCTLGVAEQGKVACS